MDKEIIKVLKDNNIVIPMYLFKNYKNLELSLEEFIMFIYLYNTNNTDFNPTKISSDLNMSLEEVMDLISRLSNKNILEIKSMKNDNGVLADYLSLEPFYTKLSLLISEKDNNEEKESDVFELIEKEFGRTLSPIEYEIIKTWIDSNTSEEVIVEAVKEAIYNGVSNLRYIDKILYEWKKDNIKTKEDVEERRKKFKSKKKEADDRIEVFDYDWFDDEERKD